MDHALHHPSVPMPIMLRTFYPRLAWTGKYGPDLIAYAMYQNIELAHSAKSYCYRYE